MNTLPARFYAKRRHFAVLIATQQLTRKLVGHTSLFITPTAPESTVNRLHSLHFLISLLWANTSSITKSLKPRCEREYINQYSLREVKNI